MVDKTEKVVKHTTPENEIRVTGSTYVVKAVERIEEAFKNHKVVTLSGINFGISNLVLITEIAKVKIGGLHQYTTIETLKTESTSEEGKKEDFGRVSTRCRIELHQAKADKTPTGFFYQAPYSEELVKEIREVKPEERDNNNERGGFRGGRGGFSRGGRGNNRGRGDNRGRGGFRGGRGRGGFRNQTGDNELTEGGVFRGRGDNRGRGGFRGGRGGDRGRGGFRGNERGNTRGSTRGNHRGGTGGVTYNQPEMRSTIPGLGGKKN